MFRRVNFSNPIAAVRNACLQCTSVTFICCGRRVVQGRIRRAMEANAYVAPIGMTKVVFCTQAVPRFTGRLRVMYRTLVRSFHLVRFSFLLRFNRLFHRIILGLVGDSRLTLFNNRGGVNQVGFMFVGDYRASSQGEICLFGNVGFVIPGRGPRRVITVYRMGICHIAFCTRVPTVRFCIIARVRTIRRTTWGCVPIRRFTFFCLSCIVVRVQQIPRAMSTKRKERRRRILPSQRRNENNDRPRFIGLFVGNRVLFCVNITKQRVYFQLMVIVVECVMFRDVVKGRALRLSMWLNYRYFIVTWCRNKLVSIFGCVYGHRDLTKPNSPRWDLYKSSFRRPFNRLNSDFQLIANKLMFKGRFGVRGDVFNLVEYGGAIVSLSVVCSSLGGELLSAF